MIKLSKQGMDLSSKKVVCVVTGSGLKDPDAVVNGAGPFLELPADLSKIEKALGWN